MEAEVFRYMMEHAARSYPAECCGLLFRRVEIRTEECRETSIEVGEFRLDKSQETSIEAGKIRLGKSQETSIEAGEFRSEEPQGASIRAGGIRPENSGFVWIEASGMTIPDRIGQAREVSNLVREEESGVNFRMDPLEICRIEQEAEVAGFIIAGTYHSHPDHEAVLSQEDREGMIPGMLYVIISVDRKGPAGMRIYWRQEPGGEIIELETG